jgi:hypothetical protein
VRTRGILVTLTLVAGCGAGTGVVAQGSVATGGSSSGLAFVGLVDGAPEDVAAISASRGVVEILTQAADGSWSSVGSFFAGGTAVEVEGARIGGRGMVVVKDQSGSIALLGADTTRPHRLDDAIQVFRRFRNGMPQDQTPPARAFALGDLDGDGSDELVVSAPGLGVAAIGDLATWLQSITSPEHVPPANGSQYDAGANPGAIAVVDVDGDGRKDVVELDDAEPALRVYGNHGGADKLASPERIALPAPGVKVAGTSCATAPVVVLLGDGRMVTVGRDGKVSPAVTDLVPVKQLAASDHAMVMTSGATSTIALYDACASTGAFLRIEQSLASSMAISPTELALLAGDGKTVSLYQLNGY